jgi:amino acid adenylation domain-containing protein
MIAHTNRAQTAQGDPSIETDRSAERGWSYGAKSIGLIFDEIAARHADQIAVTFGNQQLTYHDLHEQANRLANRLRSMGVGTDSLVGVYLERSAQAIVALVAILKAGGAYLPLDPAYPGERVAMILEDAQPNVLLTEEKFLHRLPFHTTQTVCLDWKDEKNVDWDEAVIESKPALKAGIENLAYVIYTSGSTGKPKGVMVTHANVMRLLSQTEAWFHFNENDTWTLFHSIAFDFSVWEIWGSLLSGGRLVVVPFTVSRSPEEFYELLVKEQVTVLNQTPSAFYQLMAVDQKRRSLELALRVVIFGGEALNFKTLQPWFEIHGDRKPRLVNMYGITETTVHVTYRELTVSDATNGTRSLIGIPIPDLQLHLLDGDLQPVPVGEIGEICVGGAGLARGYLNRPELSAERFIPDPYSASASARLYRSGDLARQLMDGEIEYLGRDDAQIKIHGFRIEPGEIEAALAGHALIREAHVVAHTDGAGTKRLVAYFATRGKAQLTAHDLSEYLSEKLPSWMVPSLYVAIESFPLTPHGKVDYAALPEPIAGSSSTEENVRGTELEDKVAGVWRNVLGAANVGLDDNFFDIGGTSLLLVAVHTELQLQFNRKIPVAELFAYTTVRALARKLDGGAELESSQTTQNHLLKQAERQRAAFARARAGKRASL